MEGGKPCFGVLSTQEDPFLLLFQFPALQLMMWLLEYNFWQKLQALNCGLEVSNKGSLRPSCSGTSRELIRFVVGFFILQ